LTMNPVTDTNSQPVPVDQRTRRAQQLVNCIAIVALMRVELQDPLRQFLPSALLLATGGLAVGTLRRRTIGLLLATGVVMGIAEFLWKVPGFTRPHSLMLLRFILATLSIAASALYTFLARRINVEPFVALLCAVQIALTFM